MFSRWNRAFSSLSRLGSVNTSTFSSDLYVVSRTGYAKAAAAVTPTMADTVEKSLPTAPAVLLPAAHFVFYMIASSLQ